ncbi:DUF1294 domain-containing protein [Paenilisteria rocourtiae]|uniref:Uncharacterized membrane protein YsdA (DUF1294 family) n=1 Tax=Listeria rocourtiae TaxID=647910 RepID=A0A4R6ZTR7_9LIST|nr:DUF1294 domain-containing protein [Listeria rocourtiae]EUJ43813.1 hypothetical protein PROCOU_14868 [Listeria rocourtiae FSL F6-920]MBC1605557.1 DUF1294 domain-containing protein [Listeria rocourtiae]TDR55644.1 uncharacterized membrane protein YsdA (DUF1294 family) [Listeria rocourtiae]
MFVKLLVIYYIAINSIGFASMGIDKRKAMKHQWRIPELTLLFFAFLGGGIGSWISMHLFHHKTHKLKFTCSIPISVVLHIGIVIYLMTYLQ